mgnify:CR=1 FL=1
MAYLGTPIDTQNQFQSLQGKRFSGDGSTTAFTLDIAPSSVFDIEVFVENVRQDPNSAYGISGTTLTFTGAPPSGTNNIYVVHQAKAVGTIDVPASGVVPASLASNIISGQTELAAEPADTDEFLVSDAGTIKRIDYSLIKSKGKILQVVSTDASSRTTTTSSSEQTAATSSGITPSSTSSKILVLAHGFVANDRQGDQLPTFTKIYRSVGGTETQVSSAKTAYSDTENITTHLRYISGSNNNRMATNVAYTIVDSPSTTSEVTYLWKHKNSGGGTDIVGGVVFNLLEIGA